MTTLEDTEKIEALIAKAVKEALPKAVDARVKDIKRMMVPHHCFTCHWFILRTEKPRNRVCRCPDDLEASKGGACLNWKLQDDPSKWVVNKNMSV